MKFIGLFLFFSAALSNAKVEGARASENISAQYMKAVSSDMQSLEQFKRNFKVSPKTFCPKYPGKDESSCLQSYLNHKDFKSSGEAIAMVSVIASTGLNDQKLGYTKEMLKLLLTENLLSLYEHVDLSHFYLANFHPATSAGQRELALLKSNDEKQMNETFPKVLQSLSKNLSDLEQARKVANAAQWKASKLKELRKRLNNLISNRWKY